MTTLTDEKLREMWQGEILGDHYAHYNAMHHALRLAAAVRDAAFREAAGVARTTDYPANPEYTLGYYVAREHIGNTILALIPTQVEK